VRHGWNTMAALA